MDYSNSSLVEEQAMLLQNYLDDFGVGQESDLQKDMVAKYLQCTDTDPHAPSFPGCRETLKRVLTTLSNALNVSIQGRPLTTSPHCYIN